MTHDNGPRSLLALSVALAAAGCSRPKPESVFDRSGFGSGEDTGTDGTPAQPTPEEMRAGGDGSFSPQGRGQTNRPGELAAPYVVPLPPTWSYQTIPVSGTAAPGSLLIIQGGADVGGLTEPASPGSGDFCVDVRLRPNQVNELVIRAQDASGNVSPETRVSVHHRAGTEDPEIPVEQEETGPVNLALDARYVAASGDPEDGGWFDPVDGDFDTSAQWGVGDWELSSGCNNYAWYAVGFDVPQTFQSLLVRWGDPYAAQYKVMISVETDPDPPHVDSDQWILLDEVGCGEPNGNGSTDEIFFDGLMEARWVALLMYENASGPDLDEHFRIHELELWSPEQPPTSTPMAPAPTCNNGG